jgi:hypothetical protein
MPPADPRPPLPGDLSPTDRTARRGRGFRRQDLLADDPPEARPAPPPPPPPPPAPAPAPSAWSVDAGSGDDGGPGPLHALVPGTGPTPAPSPPAGSGNGAPGGDVPPGADEWDPRWGPGRAPNWTPRGHDAWSAPVEPDWPQEWDEPAQHQPAWDQSPAGGPGWPAPAPGEPRWDQSPWDQPQGHDRASGGDPSAPYHDEDPRAWDQQGHADTYPGPDADATYREQRLHGAGPGTGSYPPPAGAGATAVLVPPVTAPAGRPTSGPADLGPGATGASPAATGDYGTRPSLGERVGGALRRYRTLAIPGLVALALRLWVITVDHGECTPIQLANNSTNCFRIVGDALYFRTQAHYLAKGHSYINPTAAAFGDLRPGAYHPPLFPTILGIFDVVGIRSIAGHRIALGVIGALTAVFVGTIAWRLAGRHGKVAGLTAATVIALSPLFWLNESLAMSEAVYVPVVAGVIAAAYGLHRHPTWRRAALLGVCVGLATLTRAEAALFLPLVALPVLWGTRRRSSAEDGETASAGMRLRRPVALLLVTGLATGAVILPWVGYNLSRFPNQTLLTTSSGDALVYRLCDQAFSGKLIGYYSMDCDPKPNLSFADESAQDVRSRQIAMQYLKDHADQVPVVLAARFGRLIEVYRPFQNAELSALLDNRGRTESYIALFCFYALLAPAGLGVIALRRARLPLSPLLGPIAVSIIATMLTSPSVRYRVAFDLALVILAGVGVADVVRRRAEHRQRAATTADAGAPAWPPAAGGTDLPPGDWSDGPGDRSGGVPDPANGSWPRPGDRPAPGRHPLPGPHPAPGAHPAPPGWPPPPGWSPPPARPGPSQRPPAWGPPPGNGNGNGWARWRRAVVRTTVVAALLLGVGPVGPAQAQNPATPGAVPPGCELSDALQRLYDAFDRNMAIEPATRLKKYAPFDLLDDIDTVVASNGDLFAIPRARRKEVMINLAALPKDSCSVFGTAKPGG